jgi:hypothetical protein
MLSTSVILGLASLGGMRAEAAVVPTQAIPLIPLGPFVRATDGDILALNDGRIRRSTDGGASWKGARMFPGGDYEALNDSALLVTKSGRVVAFFIDRKTLRYEWDDGARRLKPSSQARTLVAVSDDHGATWRVKQEVQSTYAGASRGLAEMAPGHLVAVGQEMTSAKPTNVTAIYESTDNGDTWRRRSTMDGGGRGHHDGWYEGVALAVPGGSMAVLRSTQDTLMLTRRTASGWSRPTSMNIPASSSLAGLLRLQDGRILMAYNPLYPSGERTTRRFADQGSERGASWFRREIYARWSEDEGKTWSAPRVLWRGATDAAYPTMFEIEPGRVWMTTYQGQVRLSFAVGDLMGALPVL